uniref:Palmitoyltransferase n=1 Tax=Plectus sambesii TaxID=2011161 RepID=A0A914W340_9BILA
MAVRGGDNSYEEDPLCCCEYVDADGQRTHLLFVGCDCEALDTIVDRLIRGQRVPQDTVTRLLRTLDDRARLPSLRPQGAVRVGIGFFCAFFFTALLLLLLSIHPVVTAILIISLPCCALFIQRTILRYWVDSRFFYYWSLWSFIWLGLLFCWINGRQLSLHAWLAMAVLYGTAMFAFWKTKRNNKFAPMCQRLASDGVGEAELCRHCDAERVARRIHCRVCDGCVDQRDHHCVWIDSCVSSANRIWFRLGLITALACALLGIFLSTSSSNFVEGRINM